jgi:RNA polymerase sigma-70 factor (ECF subfamily)
LLDQCLATGRHEVPAADAAAELRLEPGALRVAIRRLRRRYRELLRQEIGRTLADPSQVEVELRALLGAFRR